MRQTLNGMRKRGSEDRGFTMIELLVVVVIIGVLVAIAVPVYLNYRKGAANKSAESDVRGAVSAVEQFYTENGNKYPEETLTENNDGGDASQLALSDDDDAQVITLSDKTELTYTPGAEDGTYLICATNSGGSGKKYLYDSQKGGSVQQADDDLAIATCS